jgi:TPR repeat protein
MLVPRRKPALIAGVLAALLPRPASADLASGIAAYDAGDYVAADRELRGLAEFGDPAAAHVLARMYFAGQGVPADPRQGIRWERKAAEGGEPKAQLDLGMRHQYGLAVPRDIAAAEKWYRMAAEQNLLAAQCRLAYLLLYEPAATPDLVETHMWLNLAAAKLPIGELRRAIVAAREDVAAKMNAAEIKEAQSRARAWQPKSWRQLSAQRAAP